MSQPSFKSNIAFNTILNICNVIYPLITAPYVSRVFSPNSLGSVNFSNTYASYWLVFATLGATLYGAREVARKRGNKIETEKLFNELFSLMTCTTAFLALLYLLSLFLVPLFHDIQHLLLIAGVSLLLTPFKMEWFFTGAERFKFIAIRSLVVKLIFIGLLFIFVRKESDLVVYMILLVLSSVLNEIWNFAAFKNMGYHIRFSFKGIKQHIKPTLVFFGMVLATTAFNYIDVLMLGFWSEYDQVAYYSQAANMSKLLLSLMTGVAIAGFPRIANLAANGKYEEVAKTISDAFKLITFLILPMTVGLIMVAPTFIPLFLGINYLGTIVPLQVMALVITFIGLEYIVQSMVLNSLGYESVSLKIVISGSILNILANCILIPSQGAVGASLASAGAELCMLIAALVYDVRKISYFSFDYKEFIKTTCCALLLIPCSLLADSIFDGWYYIVSYVIFGTIVYFGSQFAMRNAVTMQAINMVKTKLKLMN